MSKGVEGICNYCSGQLGGAEIARTECGNYGKTYCNVFNQSFAKLVEHPLLLLLTSSHRRS
jgi:hypothetical protein